MGNIAVLAELVKAYNHLDQAVTLSEADELKDDSIRVRHLRNKCKRRIYAILNDIAEEEGHRTVSKAEVLVELTEASKNIERAIESLEEEIAEDEDSKDHE